MKSTDKRYILYEESRTESKILTDSNNKSEVIKVRNAYRNHIISNKFPYVWDTKDLKWIP